MIRNVDRNMQQLSNKTNVSSSISLFLLLCWRANATQQDADSEDNTLRDCD
jgi:hypothetical protein